MAVQARTGAPGAWSLDAFSLLKIPGNNPDERPILCSRIIERSNEDRIAIPNLLCLVWIAVIWLCLVLWERVGGDWGTVLVFA